MEIFPNWTVIPIIFFLIVLTFILNRTFFRPLGRTLAERHNRIEGAQKEAEQIRKASQERLAEFEIKMREARLKADQQMAQIRGEALSQRNSILSAKRSEVDQMLTNARSEIKQKTEDARKQLRSQTQTFANRIASQILKRPISRGTSTQA